MKLQKLSIILTVKQGQLFVTPANGLILVEDTKLLKTRSFLFLL